MELHRDSERKLEFINGLSREEVLHGSFDDAAFFKCTLKAGSVWEPALYRADECVQIILFAGGTGYIGLTGEAFNIREPAVFIPEFDAERFSIHAGSELCILQIVARMSDYDRREMADSRIYLPRFRPISEAWTYQEKFKTPGIRSCMLIEHRNLGRLSMGVVTGVGPSEVGQHIHNELEQWYYVLPGGTSTYMSGSEEVDVGGGDLFHIPRATYHGSRAHADKPFDYMWFELCVDGYPGNIL